MDEETQDQAEQAPVMWSMRRTDRRPDGVFSELLFGSSHFGFTLEHAYEGPEGWDAKIAPGEYTCERGEHVLGHGQHLETFEVTGVPGHSGLLFHPGNFEFDSDGCILPGDFIGATERGTWEVTRSVDAFKRFMAWNEGVQTFQLKVY